MLLLYTLMLCFHSDNQTFGIFDKEVCMEELKPALYIVPTPIGNMEDITFRAVRILREAQIICAEDTRHSRPLLEQLGITAPVLESFHDHNEMEKAARIRDWIQEGKSVALISDAGTPLISDPGYHLVVACVNAGVQVVPLPGPCAVITALEAAGFPTDRFCFEGFLPVKEKALYDRLEELRHEPRTIVFYETPRRMPDTAVALGKVFGEREIVVGREMTKAFETFYRTTCCKLSDVLASDSNSDRGEMVAVLYPWRPDPGENGVSDAALKLLRLLVTDLPVKKAVRIVSETFGCSRNEIYREALALKEEPDIG